MINQTNSAITERGGIPMRDYTLGGRPQASGNLLQRINFEKVARGLVFASLGLGLAELIFPKRIQKLVGVKRGDHSGLIRMMGGRELLHGLILMGQTRPLNGVRTRLFGDALDLGALGYAFTERCNDRSRLAIATGAILGITALDVLTAARLQKRQADARRYSVLTNEDLNSRVQGGVFHVSRSITINRSPEALYQYWHNFENLPNFMTYLESVQVLDGRRSRWVAKAPAGQTVEWEAEITADSPNELIAWQSTPNSQVPNAGAVHFEPRANGRGTEVHVDIEYRPPGGALGRTIALLFGQEPSQEIGADLRRFKQVMETGEVVRSASSPRGTGQVAQRPAQPLPDKQSREPMETPSPDELRQQQTIH